MAWPPRPLPTLALAALAALAPACADDLSSAEGTGSQESDDSSELPEELGGPARGIRITTVEANQGAGVTIAEGETWTPLEERNAYLLHGRDTLLRFQHVIEDPEAWIPRELTGILHIYPPEGEEFVRVRSFEVTGDSDPRDIGGNFYFSVLAEEAQPGTRFWLELRESDANIDVSELAEGLAATPAEPELIGFDAARLELKVTVVPVRYEFYDPPTQVEMSPEEVAMFRDDLLQQNPVQAVDISFRDEPIVWTEQLTNLGALLAPTREARIADEAPANVYYHALVDVNGPSVSSVAGIATLPGATKEDGVDRVAATVFFRHTKEGEEGEEPQTFPPSASSRTWVHEIGHNQGLRHIECPNANAAGPDPAYPHEDGKIGVYGFGIRNFHMYTPTAAHDYMSYCGNSWVSDWTWNKTYERIATLTSWDLEDAGASPVVEPTRVVLTGLVFPDGTEQWSLYEGPAPRRHDGAEALEFWAGDELLAREYAQVELLSDGRTRMISAALPTQLAGAEALGTITRVSASDGRRVVEPATIRVAGQD